MEDLFKVGVITSTHGLKGDVKVFPTTDDVNRFKQLKKALIHNAKKKNNDEYIDIEIENCKFFKNMVILKFKGINDINDVEKYKGYDIYVTRANAVPLDEGEYYIADLIDLKVLTEDGEELGILYDVLTTGANDVYEVKLKDSDKEVLIPAIKQCILNVDMEKREMTVHLLEGLMD